MYNIAMKKQPESAKIKQLLEESRGVCAYDDWIDHCLCVGRVAGLVAVALRESKVDIDVEKAITMGYLHDIGKLVGPYLGHPLRGYKYLREQGYDEEYCLICATHSFLKGDTGLILGSPDDMQAEPELVKIVTEHEYTIYDKLINLCDLLCLLRPMVLDQRLVDIMMRHGTWAGSQQHLIAAHELKDEFDRLLGYNLYDAIPEVKENL